jgi:RNA polymerase sigma-70 factor (ECF subfamily)
MMRKRRPEPSSTPVSAPAMPAKAVEPDLAAVIQALATAGRWNEARERYDELVARHQRRAVRLACYYLRDAAEADEAVQDAFVKAFAHLASFDPARSFEVWFTRILVNSCLDRVKARKRRLRWQIAMADTGGAFEPVSVPAPATAPRSPETVMLRRERARQLLSAIQQLPLRQRTVIMLSHLDGRSTREVSEMTGLSESTVRVHLFRGLRRLRSLVSRT